MGLVFDRPIEVLEAIYASMCSEPIEKAMARKHGITLARYIDTYYDSLIVGLEIESVLAGGMFFHHPGIVHVGILPQYRARWARWLRPMLEIGFKEYGSPLRALVSAGNKRAQEFVERVGCVRALTTSLVVEYEVIQGRMHYGRMARRICKS